jgi:hypothetical protein
MVLKSVRFGEIEIDDRKIVTFPTASRASRARRGSRSYFMRRRAHQLAAGLVERPFVSLPVWSLSGVCRTMIQHQRRGRRELSVINGTICTFCNVVVIPEKLENMTVNLAAPILINIRANLGKQIIFDRKNYQIQYPAFAAICKYYREGKRACWCCREKLTRRSSSAIRSRSRCWGSREKVKLGIEAPISMRILREELIKQTGEENLQALRSPLVTFDLTNLGAKK